LKILLVEDSDDCREVTKEYLESVGYAVSEAADGLAALELLSTEPEPALVILDLEMPRMTGGELLLAMKEHERLARLPVLIVSGSANSVVPIGGSVVGFAAKPILGKNLLERVQASLGHRDTQKSID
jgi:CheY-like chemotaxis protein